MQDESSRYFKFSISTFIPVGIDLLILLQIVSQGHARSVTINDFTAEEGESSNLRTICSEHFGREADNGKPFETTNIDVMELNYNCDLVIMTNQFGNHPGKSIHLQTFVEFYEAQTPVVDDLNMDESSNDRYNMIAI